MKQLLLVCLGGAAGSGARYLVGTWAQKAFAPGFPVGTLLVNVIGSFLIGVIMGLSLKTEAISPAMRLFLAVGVMGGFTTYSSFNYETLRLALEGAWRLAVLNVSVTLAACAVAGVLGAAVASFFAGFRV